MLLLSAFEDRSYFAVAQSEVALLFDTQSFLILQQFGTLSGPPVFSGTSASNIVVYDGSFSYRGILTSFFTGEGNDRLFIGAGDGQMVGNIYINAGDGDDLIVTGYIEGSNSAGAGLDGGDGHDTIRVLDTFRGAGMFANAAFFINGGSGDDDIELEGTQFNLRGSNINVVDGGAGFDNYRWNLTYDLGNGTNQTGVDATATPYPLEIGVQNVERLYLKPTNSGHTLTLSAVDVATISSGSSFDRSTLGLSFSGFGETLFLAFAGQRVDIDLSGWTLEGMSSASEGLGHQVYSSGTALLVVDPQLLIDVPSAVRHVVIDGVAGATLRLADYFTAVDPTSTFSVTDSNGDAVSFASWDEPSGKILIASGETLPPSQAIFITEHQQSGSTVSVQIQADFTNLTFNHIAAAASVPFASTGDLNGDGLTDIFGAFQNADGSFSTMALASHGLASLAANSRVLRDNRLIDFDNNGTLDVVANTYAPSSAGPNIVRLFSNDGTGHFTEVQSFADQNIQGYGETIIAADFNNDGLTDFYLPHYFRNDPSAPALPGEEDHGGNYDGPPVIASRLMINQGNLVFQDQTSQWDITNSAGSLSLKGFSSVFDSREPEGAQALDFNRDGLIDFWVASHLFINQGGSFYDANTALGLPVEFDEGALFLDWNNDGYFDLLKILPEVGPVLYEYKEEWQRFEATDAFDAKLHYEDAYGVTTADYNGDGWLDVYFGRGSTLTPRIFINQQGQSFVEYRSTTTEQAFSNAAPASSDINSDGKTDLVLGSGFGILQNAVAGSANVVTVELLGANGEHNQHGRVVELVSINPLDTRVMTRAVDGGSGYISQGDYRIQFADSQAGQYTAQAYLIDYGTGASVRISFAAETGHSYKVYAASEFSPAQVFDTTSNSAVPFERHYAANATSNDITIKASGLVHIDARAGDDVVAVETNTVLGWNTSTFDGGDGDDNVSFTQTSAMAVAPLMAESIGLSGGAGNDLLSIYALDLLNVTVDGGAGQDTVRLQGLHGNAGVALGSESDVVAFEAVSGVLLSNAVVTISDFETGSSGDRIDWANFLENALSGWDGSINPFATGHLQLTQEDTDVLLNINYSGSILTPLMRFNNISLNALEAYNLGGFDNYTYVLGSTDSETLSGGVGRDSFNGNGGSDVLEGYGGDDVYNVDDLTDVVFEVLDEGFDSVFTAADYDLASGQAIEFIGAANGFSTAALNFKGNEFDQALQGTTASNIMFGMGGSDFLYGQGGQDILSGGTGNNILDGGDDFDTALYDEEETAVVVTLAGSNAAIVYIDGSARDILFNIEGLVGGKVADVLTGDSLSNTLDGREGADVLTGQGGNDLYIVENVGDRVIELVNGGSDKVVADVSYNLNYGSEVETLSTRTHAATDAITLRGNEYAQTIFGNAGINTLDGRGGIDTLIGFGGADTYIVGDARVKVIESVSGGLDRVIADVSYVLTSGSEVEVVTTRSHAATFAINLSGNESAQNLQGNFGVNILDGRGGADVMEGYRGDDIYIVDNAGDVVIELVGEGLDKVVADITHVLNSAAEIEILSTRTHADTTAINLTGNGFAQTLYGNFGDNTLDGRGGADRMIGLKGNDIYIVDHFGDVIVEAVAGGNDRVVADVNYVLSGYAEVETLSTRTHSATQAINLTGNEFGQLIQGNFGVNTLDGRAGADTLVGFLGDDKYIVDNLGDVVVEAVGGGVDRVVADVSWR
jgi:Ca2+-binding RTX toxin-like protein